MPGVDTLSDCEIWLNGQWTRVAVSKAIGKYGRGKGRCYKCHGFVLLMKESHDGRKRAHAEHRPTYEACPLTHKFIPGTPFSFSPNAIEDPAELDDPLDGLPHSPDRSGRIPKQDDESEFPEGNRKFKQHSWLERDRPWMRGLKDDRLAEVGKLECEVCKVDFVARYGEIGKGFIEGHHKIPVSQIGGKKEKKKTHRKDIAFVCSNCHRMLHRAKPLLTTEQLREIYLSRNK